MTITAGAERRIRHVARGVGVVGVVIALVTVAGVVLTGFQREAAQASRHPWEASAPLEAQREPGGSVWEAEGSARITLPAELLDRPIGMQLLEEVPETVFVYLGDDVADSRPRFLGSVDEYQAAPVAAYDNSVLWITSSHAWRIEILPIDATEFEQTASGDAHALFVYRGDATSGTITWGPGGTLFIIARSVAGYESLVVTGGDPAEERGGTERFEWTASPFIVIEVSAYDGIEWEIQLDAVPSATPTADETPADEVPTDEGQTP